MPSDLAPFAGLAVIAAVSGLGILLVLFGLRLAKPTPPEGWQSKLMWKGKGRELRRK